MKYLLFLLLSISLNATTAYPSSESCNECHEKIYREHTASMHHNSSIFKDEVCKDYYFKRQKGDEITSIWISYIVNPNIAKKLDIKTVDIVKPYMGDEVSLYIY